MSASQVGMMRRWDVRAAPGRRQPPLRPPRGSGLRVRCAAEVPPNVLEARQWIATWRAKQQQAGAAPPLLALEAEPAEAPPPAAHSNGAADKFSGAPQADGSFLFTADSLSPRGPPSEPDSDEDFCQDPEAEPPAATKLRRLKKNAQSAAMDESKHALNGHLGMDAAPKARPERAVRGVAGRALGRLNPGPQRPLRAAAMGRKAYREDSGDGVSLRAASPEVRSTGNSSGADEGNMAAGRPSTSSDSGYPTQDKEDASSGGSSSSAADDEDDFMPQQPRHSTRGGAPAGAATAGTSARPARAARGKQLGDLNLSSASPEPASYKRRHQPRRAAAAGTAKRRVADTNSSSSDGEATDSSSDPASSSLLESGGAGAAGGRPQRRTCGRAGDAGRSDSAGDRSPTCDDAADGMPQVQDEAGCVLGAAMPVISQRKQLARATIERILAVRYAADGSMEVHIKLEGQSYRKTRWVAGALVEELRANLLTAFLKKRAAEEEDAEARGRRCSSPTGDAANCMDGIEPEWLEVERIIACKTNTPTTLWLTKWRTLEYSAATWESEADLLHEQDAIRRFEAINTPPLQRSVPKRPTAAQVSQRELLPEFRNGRSLRSYQEDSLFWMLSNYRGSSKRNDWCPTNCILGDEMGLGKTAQSISVLAWLRQYAATPGPFMVVAPLTTLGHWQREIETWTDMNAVLYAGSQSDRQLIQAYEFWHTGKGVGSVVKFDVLLISFETLLRDARDLRKLHLQVAIIDEAHRLKSANSAIRGVLESMKIKWKLLLTGTPIQNNMRELWGILSFLDPEEHGDLDVFLEAYGDAAPSVEQVQAIQAVLRPLLLRRMKEDVETLPEKEEVVIWVDLTKEQRAYYRALYTQKIGVLLAGVKSGNLPGMRNLAMELRKLCCHPYLCNGLEEDIAARRLAAASGAVELPSERELLVRASGKMLLLDKLLPKLRAEGRQVLIFSQFKIMLDVLEDYLDSAGHAFERIDGSVGHRARQAAIERFTRKGAGGSGADAATEATALPADGGTTPAAHGDAPFIFLLSTRAGGQGITLTTADTVIIYDSDWNPQNDLQAMARCHRIGQEKEVTVYRLVTRDTYEQKLFEVASLKYGLDEAILGSSGGASAGGGDPEADATRIAQLLQHGAHALAAAPDGGGDAEGGEECAMAGEDINQILQGRTEKRQIGSRAGNTFSVATFKVAEDDPPVPLDAAGAQAYWNALLPEAVDAHEAAKAAERQPEALGPRKRRVVSYKESQWRHVLKGQDDSNDSSYHVDAGAEDDAGTQGDDSHLAGKKKGKRAHAGGDGDTHPSDNPLGRRVERWSAKEVEVCETWYLRLGRRPEVIISKAGLIGRQPDEVLQLCDALRTMLTHAARLERDKARLERERQEHEVKRLLEEHARWMEEMAVPRAGAGGATPCAPNSSDVGGRQQGGAEEQARGPDLMCSGKKKIAVHLDLQAAVAAMQLPWALVRALSGVDALRRSSGRPQVKLNLLREHEMIQRLADSPGGLSSALKRVDLRAWHMPAWWSAEHDDALVHGCYQHGYVSWRLAPLILDIMYDPALGFDKTPLPIPPKSGTAPGAAAAGGVAGVDGQAAASVEWPRLLKAIAQRATDLRDALLSNARAETPGGAQPNAAQPAAAGVPAARAQSTARPAIKRAADRCAPAALPEAKRPKGDAASSGGGSDSDDISSDEEVDGKAKPSAGALDRFVVAAAAVVKTAAAAIRQKQTCGGGAAKSRSQQQHRGLDVVKVYSDSDADEPPEDAQRQPLAAVSLQQNRAAANASAAAAAAVARAGAGARTGGSAACGGAVPVGKTQLSGKSSAQKPSKQLGKAGRAGRKMVQTTLSFARPRT